MRLDIAGMTLWGAFLVSWYAGMLWTARALKRNSVAGRAMDVLVYAIAFGLLPLGLILLSLEAGAFAFAWWARLALGRLWSGMITLREGHRVIQTGPYRLVRHPIYTGFLGAAWSFALLVGAPRPLLGALLLTATMALKARREETFLRQELGEAAYDDYARRTPMLVPFLKAAGSLHHR
jgi:protein-S-isoprenylcysteine O-methyltransferase Ste14